MVLKHVQYCLSLISCLVSRATLNASIAPGCPPMAAMGKKLSKQTLKRIARMKRWEVIAREFVRLNHGADWVSMHRKYKAIPCIGVQAQIKKLLGPDRLLHGEFTGHKLWPSDSLIAVPMKNNVNTVQTLIDYYFPPGPHPAASMPGPYWAAPIPTTTAQMPLAAYIEF